MSAVSGRIWPVLLHEVVSTSAAVTRSPGRLAKVAEIASLLAQVPPDEVLIAVAFLSGELTQRQIGVGYSALIDLPDSSGGPAQPRPVLTLAETDAAFETIGALSGPGSQAQRRSMLASLLDRATDSERQFVFRLLAGGLSQGALEGVMTEAVARAAGVPATEVRRAHQLCGSLPEVARAALLAVVPAGSAQADRVTAALRAFTLQVGRPVRPMLAASAPSLEAAFGRISPAVVEWKIDGIRIQIHRDGQQVRVFTRTLEDITARVPEIAAIGASLRIDSAVLDGEAVALRPDGRPRPFQVTSARVASQAVAGRAGDRGSAGEPGQPPKTGQPGGTGGHREPVALTAFLFDLLHADGQDLMDQPASERFERLASIAPAGLLIPRMITSDSQEATEFFLDAIGRGHEGVVVKSADAPYRAGRRGSDWIKVKPRTTADLVILAAEWGHGRRSGLLSNLHLGARDPVTGGFVMLGKTFKGLTDAMLTWQTARLLDLADPPVAPAAQADPGEPAAAGQERGLQRGVVRVRPVLVAEIAFDGVQASRRYPGGVTLRFARVLRHRPDKSAAEADTIESVRALWPEEPAD